MRSLEKFLGDVIYSHYVAYYITGHSRVDILDSILIAMNSINGRVEEIRISIAGRVGEINSRVKFEVKWVRRSRLRRFNRKTMEFVRRIFRKGCFDSIDFLVTISYRYRRENGEWSRAWSDRYLVRFQVGNVTFRVYISSIGGLRRITPKEMGRRIYLEIIRSLRRKGVRPIIRRVREVT